MASEILVVPEGALEDVLAVIRLGLNECSAWLPADTFNTLTDWCDEEEEYLAQLARDEWDGEGEDE